MGCGGYYGAGGSCGDGRLPRRKVRLEFKRCELLYDVGNYAFVEGDLMKVESEHDRHQTIDVVEDGNVDRVTRVLNLAHAECVELLFPYSKRPLAAEEVRDDVLREPEVYVVELWVPWDFSQTSVDLLSPLIHEYLVYRVLEDWLSITHPESAPNWGNKLADVRGKVRKCLATGRGRVRRGLSPF